MRASRTRLLVFDDIEHAKRTDLISYPNLARTGSYAFHRLPVAWFQATLYTSQVNAGFIAGVCREGLQVVTSGAYEVEDLHISNDIAAHGTYSSTYIRQRTKKPTQWRAFVYGSRDGLEPPTQ